MVSIKRTQLLNAVKDIRKNKKTIASASSKTNMEAGPCAIASIREALLSEASDYDEEKVRALKMALKNGSLPFDSEKLARMIQQFHGVQGENGNAQRPVEGDD
ncbi:flagellar biosynthesis anti-sigma factor FlgM [Chromobacterium haemolyticum]|uniref:flagellar biosynthesis anti-sigma factor FlgM n=1 Tax=Chromobacterium haemolyticum TaxID=394935 RepID=UPI0009DA9938|nr:flagellar biosynthesis anti-sigma factor FlgM [Chromobacterium haemolyticum]OQS33870.1 hypothetical protein B0T39_20325 [Chromobacterium haemolyticum]